MVLLSIYLRVETIFVTLFNGDQCWKSKGKKKERKKDKKKIKKKVLAVNKSPKHLLLFLWLLNDNN